MSRTAAIAAIKAKLAATNTSPLGDPKDVVSTNCLALDASLPLGGFYKGSLVEFIGGAGMGASWLAMSMIGSLHSDSYSVIIDRLLDFYPPAAERWGVDFSNLPIIQPASIQDELWSIDQCLRCPDLSYVLAFVDSIPPHTYRRFQLAAESSGCIGLLVRPHAALKHPSWANYRLHITRRPPKKEELAIQLLSPQQNIEVAVLASRSVPSPFNLSLTLNEKNGFLDETRHSCENSELAGSAIARKTA